MQRLTVAWLVWVMTGFGFWLGLVATIDPLIRIFLDQIAVLLAGCRNRKRMTLQCQSANIVVVRSLAFLLSFGQLDRYGLLAFAILNSIIFFIQQPVRMPLTATLVEKPQILKAVTRMTINAYLGRFVAPMIVGPVLAYVETRTSFSRQLASFAAWSSSSPLSMLEIRATRYKNSRAGARSLPQDSGSQPRLFVVPVAVGIRRCRSRTERRA